MSGMENWYGKRNTGCISCPSSRSMRILASLMSRFIGGAQFAFGMEARQRLAHQFGRLGLTNEFFSQRPVHKLGKQPDLFLGVRLARFLRTPAEFAETPKIAFAQIVRNNAALPGPVQSGHHADAELVLEHVQL